MLQCGFIESECRVLWVHSNLRIMPVCAVPDTNKHRQTKHMWKWFLWLTWQQKTNTGKKTINSQWAHSDVWTASENRGYLRTEGGDNSRIPDNLWTVWQQDQCWRWEHVIDSNAQSEHFYFDSACAQTHRHTCREPILQHYQGLFSVWICLFTFYIDIDEIFVHTAFPKMYLFPTDPNPFEYDIG